MILSEGTVLNDEDTLRLQRTVQTLQSVQRQLAEHNYGLAASHVEDALNNLPIDSGPCWDWRGF